MTFKMAKNVSGDVLWRIATFQEGRRRGDISCYIILMSEMIKRFRTNGVHVKKRTPREPKKETPRII